jgi:hypothetical protein
MGAIKTGDTVLVKHPRNGSMLIAIVAHVDNNWFVAHDIVTLDKLKPVRGRLGGLQLRITDIQSIL